MLEKFMDDLNNRRCIEIQLIWSNSEKSGIGNENAINVAIGALKEELEKQIDNCY